jgi:hypothetical protein
MGKLETQFRSFATPFSCGATFHNAAPKHITGSKARPVVDMF